jgi:hypothetical protein
MTVQSISITDNPPPPVNCGALRSCPHCPTLRPMLVKGIRPGFFGSPDRIEYQCGKCGGTKIE